MCGDRRQVLKLKALSYIYEEMTSVLIFFVNVFDLKVSLKDCLKIFKIFFQNLKTLPLN